MAKERRCITCHTKYEYCPHCGKSDPNESWRMIYCNEDCMALDKIRDQFKVGKITKETAQSLASQYKRPAEFADWCRPTFEEIFSSTAMVEPVVEEVIEANPVSTIESEEPAQVEVEAPAVEERPIGRNRRNKKYVNEVITEE